MVSMRESGRSCKEMMGERQVSGLELSVNEKKKVASVSVTN